MDSLGAVEGRGDSARVGRRGDAEMQSGGGCDGRELKCGRENVTCVDICGAEGVGMLV